MPLTTLSKAQKRQALERFAMLRPALEEGVSQTHIARNHQMGLSTVQRWIKLYREKVLAGDFTDQEAVATILRVTRGNIRLIERLMMQVEHILAANELKVVTKEVVEAARENLIIRDWAKLPDRDSTNISVEPSQKPSFVETRLILFTNFFAAYFIVCEGKWVRLFPQLSQEQGWRRTAIVREDPHLEKCPSVQSRPIWGRDPERERVGRFIIPKYHRIE